MVIRIFPFIFFNKIQSHLFFERSYCLFVDFLAFMRHFSVSCKTVCIKCHIRYRFQLQEGLVFPFCPSPTVHSGNHAIHSAPPPSVLSLAKLHRFFLFTILRFFSAFSRPAQHRQRRHTGEVDFYRIFVIFTQFRHTLVSPPVQRTRT